MSLDKEIKKLQIEYGNLMARAKTIESKLAALHKKRFAEIIQAPSCSVKARKSAG